MTLPRPTAVLARAEFTARRRPNGRRSDGSAGSAGRLLLLATLGAGLASCGGAYTEPTGVLLISIDSLRADHVSGYGYRSATAPQILTTPTLDQYMIEDGAMFERAFSTTSWTLPAHMALLSGQPNEVHGVKDAPWQLHGEQPWLPTAFSEAGWSTFGIWSGPNLNPAFGFARGFDHYHDASGLDSGLETFMVEDDEDWKELNREHDASHRVVTGPLILDAFTEWFDELTEDEKFFAFVHMWDPHYDYFPPESYDVFFPGAPASWIDSEGFQFKDLTWIAGQKPLARNEQLRLLSLYDAEIRYTDANIRTLFELLEQSGRLDSTLIVVASDHGEDFGEHGVYGHKLNLYDETLRIPLMMRFPGTIPEKYLVSGTTSIVDIAPTVLDIAGLPGAENMWGRSNLTVFTEEMELTERAAPMELTVRNETQFRGARGRFQATNYKVIDVGESKREALQGTSTGDPRHFKLIEQFVDRFPEVRMGLYVSSTREFDEKRPNFLVTEPGVKASEAIRPYVIDTNNRLVQAARALWADVDTAAKAWTGRRKKGELDEALLRQLEAMGYSNMSNDTGEDEGSGVDGASDGAAPRDTTGTGAAGSDTGADLGPGQGD